MIIAETQLKQVIREELKAHLIEEGFMDAIKQKIGLKPDERPTIEKIKTNPDFPRGPGGGIIFDLIKKYASEEELEILLSALEQPLGAAHAGAKQRKIMPE